MTIMTVTLNPSIDILYTLKDFQLGKTNRVPSTLKMVGGKGINTSRVTSLLKQDTLAIGLVAGSNGDFIIQELNKENVPNKFITIEGESRNAITIMHNDCIQTELNEKGPDISDTDLDQLTALILDSIDEQKVTIISLAGRIYGDYTDYYSKIVSIIKSKHPNVFISVDTSGKALKSILLNDTQPDFIKPNLTELSEFVGFEVDANISELKKVLNFTIFKSVYAIIVSLGSEGAFAKVGDNFYTLSVPNISVVNPTGSGDSTVAGFLTGINKKLSIEESLVYAMACGVSNAQEEKVGFISEEVFTEILTKINVNKI